MLFFKSRFVVSQGLFYQKQYKYAVNIGVAQMCPFLVFFMEKVPFYYLYWTLPSISKKNPVSSKVSQ